MNLSSLGLSDAELYAVRTVAFPALMSNEGQDAAGGSLPGIGITGLPGIRPGMMLLLVTDLGIMEAEANGVDVSRLVPLFFMTMDGGLISPDPFSPDPPAGRSGYLFLHAVDCPEHPGECPPGERRPTVAPCYIPVTPN